MYRLSSSRGLVLLGFFLLGCDWDGTVYLENDTGTGLSDTSLDTNTQSDEDTGTSSGEDFPTDTEWISAMDLLVVRVHVPQEFNGNPRNLCGILSSEPQSVLVAADASVCYPHPHIPPDYVLELTFPPPAFSGLEGVYHVSAVLYMEGGAEIDTPPRPGIDYFGFAPRTVVLEPGMGFVDAGDILLSLVPD